VQSKEVVMQTMKAIRIAAVVLTTSWAGLASAQNITGQVVGTVTNGDTGQPVAGARVTASSPGWIDQWVTTDAKGFYAITLLPPETYAIVVQAPGYAQAVSPGVPVAIDWRVRNDVKLASSTSQAPGAPAAGQVASR
jgi:hypothetical protein